MARINVVVAVTANPGSTIIETKVAGGDELTRTDVTELILAHLGELWVQLGQANSVRGGMEPITVFTRKEERA